MKTVIITLSLALLILIPVGVMGQSDSPVTTISQGMAAVGYQQILVYSGGNLTYRCVARSIQDTSTLPTVSAATLASTVVFTSTAHGLDYQSGATTTPTVFISGGTGDWTAVNGMWIATPTSANTFSIPVDSSMFAAFGSQALTVTTRAPRTTALIWAIQKFVYDATPNLIWSGWAANSTGTTLPQLRGGGPDLRYACSSRASYAYE